MTEKTVKEMKAELRLFYREIHPEWRKLDSGELNDRIMGNAIAELYAVMIGQFGSLEDAVKEAK